MSRQPGRARICKRCGFTRLSTYNSSSFCYACQRVIAKNGDGSIEQAKKIEIGKPNLKSACLGPRQRRLLFKDQYKSDQADILLVTPGSIGAAGEYLDIWKRCGKLVNTIKACGVYYIAVNHKHKKAKPPPYKLIRKAADLHGAFLTDSCDRRPIGEQLVARFLYKLGYTEAEECGGYVARWEKP